MKHPQLDTYVHSLQEVRHAVTPPRIVVHGVDDIDGFIVVIFSQVPHTTHFGLRMCETGQFPTFYSSYEDPGTAALHTFPFLDEELSTGLLDRTEWVDTGRGYTLLLGWDYE